MDKTTRVIDSGIKVSLPVVAKSVVVERRISSANIANDITSRIMGKLVGYDDLYDPKTMTFKTENELKAVGAIFMTISLNKVLGKSDTTVKGRTTKNPTPFIRKTSKYQVIGNVNWTSFINKRGNGTFVSAEQRSNGIVNYENCKAIGKTTKGDFTINGVAFRVLEKTKYYDEEGREYSDIIGLKNEYFKKTHAAEQKAKQKEADKHGIDVRFDPKYRTTRIDNCDSIRAFGFDYKPTDNHHNS